MTDGRDGRARWTSPPRAHYDPLVDRVTSASRRHVRPTSTIRGALIAGFAVVFGLWLLSGYELIRRLQDVEQQVAKARASVERGDRTLSAIRANVLLGSIYLRDALIDSGDISREHYRNELQQIRSDIERNLPASFLDVQLPIEREHWAQLQTGLDQYWATLDLVFSPDLPRNTAQAASFLRREVLPHRRHVLSVIDNLAALQRLAQQRHEVETALLYYGVRTRFIVIVSGALVLGIIVAVFAVWHVGGLEREIERKRLAETENRRDLQRLSARLVDAQEEERRSLSRELHDEVGQALTAIKMEIGVALRSTDSGARARASLEEARTIAESTLQSVRDMSQLLHPSTLDDFGLPETITAYLRSFSKRTGIRAQFTPEGLDGRLPTDVEVCVYRIVQEALTNIARHSGAHACSVSLSRAGERLQLVVEDDGRGMAPGPAGARPGLGLIGMRERAQALDGTFAITARPQAGTRLVVTLPVPSSEAAQRLAG